MAIFRAVLYLLTHPRRRPEPESADWWAEMIRKAGRG